MAYRTLPGYLGVIKSKEEIILDLDGPSSYNNTGAFATSGQTVNAADFGVAGFEMVDRGDLSSDGLNTFLIQHVGMSTKTTPSGPNAPVSSSFVIHWFVQATGLEVANGTDLSGKSVRLQLRVV